MVQVDRMIADADVSGDGRVDYAEFAHLWKTSALQKHHKPVASRLQQVRLIRVVCRTEIRAEKFHSTTERRCKVGYAKVAHCLRRLSAS